MPAIEVMAGRGARRAARPMSVDCRPEDRPDPWARPPGKTIWQRALQPRRVPDEAENPGTARIFRKITRLRTRPSRATERHRNPISCAPAPDRFWRMRRGRFSSRPDYGGRGTPPLEARHWAAVAHARPAARGARGPARSSTTRWLARAHCSERPATSLRPRRDFGLIGKPRGPSRDARSGAGRWSTAARWRSASGARRPAGARSGPREREPQGATWEESSRSRRIAASRTQRRCHQPPVDAGAGFRVFSGRDLSRGGAFNPRGCNKIKAEMEKGPVSTSAFSSATTHRAVALVSSCAACRHDRLRPSSAAKVAETRRFMCGVRLLRARPRKPRRTPSGSAGKQGRCWCLPRRPSYGRQGPPPWSF